MKLKALKPRLHNAMFHTHTVSGIVISFALFVCFYAGAVALFVNEIYRWENPEARFEAPDPTTIDYDRVVTSVKDNVPNFDPTVQFGFFPPTKEKPLITFYGATNDENDNVERFTATVNPKNFDIDYGEEPKTHMANTIYELHFFHQIPGIGLYLSGFVAFFFLFAIITGLLTHWKNIANKFYAFTTEGKWKQIWTNGHISLGFITLPFQIIFAVTGSLLCLSILLLAPSAFLMFDGDTNEVLKAVRPDAGFVYEESSPQIENGFGFNDAFHKVAEDYNANSIGYMYARNFGKKDGTVNVRVDDHTTIGGDGIFVFSHKDGEVLEAIEPINRSYAKGTFGVLVKLHYATFGGIFLKIIYFILAMITCYIIISGVMIWRTARDNNRYTEKQRRFHHRVTKVYLAICLSMFPALGLIFLANKLVPMELPERVVYVNTTFFFGWLGLAIIGLFWNDYRKLNRTYVVLGSIFGLLIPIANGAVTGDWFWLTLLKGDYYVFSVDITWLLIGVVGLLIARYYLGEKEKKERLKATIRQTTKVRESTEKHHPQVVLQDSLRK